MIVRRFLLVAAIASIAMQAAAGPIFTAEVYDTPGMPGYQTFDISVSISNGDIYGFSFAEMSGLGITGSLHQATIWEGGSAFSESPSDTGFLAPGGPTLSLGVAESFDSLFGVFSFKQVQGSAMTRTAPMARVVTDDPYSVALAGKVWTSELWSDGRRGDTFFPEFSIALSDVTIGLPPELPPPPDRPQPPVVSPPVVAPPAVEPPPIAPPPIAPPVVEPPAIDPAPVTPPPSIVEPPVFEIITVTTGLWTPPPPPTREEYLTSLEQQAGYVPDRIARSEAQLARVAELREQASDPDFEPSFSLLPYGAPPFQSSSLESGEVFFGGGGLGVDAWIPQQIALDDFLERLGVIETSAIASIDRLRSQAGELEALIAEASDPDFVPTVLEYLVWPEPVFFVDRSWFVPITNLVDADVDDGSDLFVTQSSLAGTPLRSAPEPSTTALITLMLSVASTCGMRLRDKWIRP